MNSSAALDVKHFAMLLNVLRGCGVFQGTELLVWYGESYLQFMGIPVSLKEMADTGNEQELESESKQFYNSSRWCVDLYNLLALNSLSIHSFCKMFGH